MKALSALLLMMAAFGLVGCKDEATVIAEQCSQAHGGDDAQVKACVEKFHRDRQAAEIQRSLGR